MFKLKSWGFKHLQKHHEKVKWISYILNIASLLALGFWVSGQEIKFFSVNFDQEAVFALFTALFVMLNQLYQWLLRESDYSPAYALATGYVSNFLTPTITQLIEDGQTSPILYIYRVRDISELYKDNVDRTKATIRNKKFEIHEVNLKPKNARARDVMMIEKSKTKFVYFDFPNTLTSLMAYIDYKVGSREDESSLKKQERLAQKLVEKFYQKVAELTAKQNISENIAYCDKSLKFNF